MAMEHGTADHVRTLGWALLIGGGAITLCLGQPWALLVVWVGWKVLRSAERRPSVSLGAGPEDSARLRMAWRIVDLGLLMAAADGHVDPRELDTIRYFFRAHGADDGFIRVVDARLMNPDLDPDAIFAEVRRLANKADREVVLIALLAVAVADGRLDPAEVAMYQHIAAGMGFTEAEAWRVFRATLGVEESPEGARGMSRDQALAVLELDADPSPAEIKAAYRRLARTHHPDKVAHLGPELVAVAQERMTRINQAVEVLRA